MSQLSSAPLAVHLGGGVSLLKMDDLLQENSDKSVIELQQYAKKNKPNLHILNKLQDEMKKLARQRVRLYLIQSPFVHFDV